VLGVAHDTGQAVQMAADHRPAVLLLDASLPGEGPLKAPAAVRAASPATRVLLLRPRSAMAWSRRRSRPAPTVW
jgi:DNA-binding NarL/FixJ family response regulator